MSPKTYTTAEVAEELEISRQTLYSWIERGHVVAPKAITAGKRSFRLWTSADIERARRFKGMLKPGPQMRPKKKN
jgi:excisionase family DNA binding protein